MLKYKKWIGGTLLFPLILIFMDLGTAFPQLSTNYQIKKSVTDQGGAPSLSTNYRIVDAVGQPSPVGEASSSNYIICSGFLGGGLMTSTDVDKMDKPFIPIVFTLRQNYPNPFNPETSIEYHLPNTSEVFLTIYNLHGHEVRNLIHETQPAGSYTVQWDGRDESDLCVASGIYFYQIHVRPKNSRHQSYMDVRKMLFLK